MSCEKGFRAIVDEARWQLLETPDDITAFVEALSSTNKRASSEMMGLFYWPKSTAETHSQNHLK